MPSVSLYRPVQRSSADQRNLAQAMPRPARVRFFVNVTGAGETRLLDGAALMFDTFFLEEPTFMYGFALAKSPALGNMPLASAMVVAYITNDLGLFVGADMGFRVDSKDTTIRTKFSLTFEGYAVRTTAELTK